MLVTGVGRYLGARVAARLAGDPAIGRVIGIDPNPTTAGVDLAGVELRESQLRTGELLKLFGSNDVTAVAHLAVATAPESQRGGRAAMKESNVIGTMQLLAACQQAPRLRKLVVRSSTAAYGASFRDPAVFTEDTEPRDVPRGGFARDVLDIEGYVRGFCRRRRDVAATVLRFAPFIGQQAETRLSRYFSMPVVPTVLGRDPRLQFVHVDDALEVLHRAIVGTHPGTYNVAGRGVLTLNQAIRRAGRIAAPTLEPGLSGVAAFAKRSGMLDFSLDQLDLFVHGRVVDTTALIEEFGFEPRTTAEAFDEFVRAQQPGPLRPQRLREAEKLILERIRRVRSALESSLESSSDD
ncbi:NAD-dependent epimerase/dehydratase family protein [Virgisporangium ochraceum]|uniref:NAD-dependent epimerase/dehydratase family protein n=1 Tax=Virgisporangium ochraceum TaxID=65505 RepID=UPI001EF24B57|nr:NAD-dependent epimerase/dehydratase family protein [Virgisporangium ochraceum]